MTEAMTQLEQAIQQAASQYYRLVILAGLPGSGKTTALQSVAQKLGCQLLNVNLELSKRMLELTRTQRSRQVERLLREVIAAASGEVLLLENLRFHAEEEKNDPAFAKQLASLCELEMRGIIRQMPGKQFVKVLL